MDAKEEVRARLAIEDIVGEYVQLKRAGRNWKGLSPFSQEKTASFFVSPDKAIWHDFSSNKGGDIFSFVMEMEGTDFRGALELLARKAGVDLGLYSTEKGKSVAKKKQRLIEVMDLATTFYQRSLLKSSKAIEYVSKQRGLSREIVHAFRIGYAPSDGTALMAFLRAKSVDDREMKDAGLTSQRRTGVGDMFRERMMVSLADAQGQPIGFTARLLDDTIQAPKYINTPQTLLYDKSRHVFGLHLAKEAIRSKDMAVIVEGNLDVISSHQAGVRYVVATAGTAITEHHVKILSRLTHHIVLAFDGDKAGIAATERAIPIAQQVGVELKIISLPDGAKDPDELIQKDVALWERAIADAKPAVEWVIDQYVKRHDVTSAQGKRLLTTEALRVISTLSDPVEKEHYMNLLAERAKVSIAALTERLTQLTQPQTSKPLKTRDVAKSGAPSQDDINQDYLLALMAIDDSTHDVAKKLHAEELDGDARRVFFRWLLEHDERIDADNVPAGLREIETYVKIVLFKAETRYADQDGQSRLVEAVSLVRRIKHQQRRQKKQLLTEALREAEATHDDETADGLRRELIELIKEETRA